jgi:Skp family chaperone for outer membrane proteins
MKYLITFLFLVLLTLGFKASADTQEALDVAKEKGLVDLSPSEPEIGIVFAVCIFENADGTKKLVDHREAIKKYKQMKIDGTAVGSFIFACDKVKAEIEILENGDWRIVKILGKYHEAYKKKKSYE